MGSRSKYIHSVNSGGMPCFGLAWNLVMLKMSVVLVHVIFLVEIG